MDNVYRDSERYALLWYIVEGSKIVILISLGLKAHKSMHFQPKDGCFWRCQALYSLIIARALSALALEASMPNATARS